MDVPLVNVRRQYILMLSLCYCVGKLPPLGVLTSGLIREKELIDRYFITGDKLIEDLQTWLLSLVPNIRKVAWG